METELVGTKAKLHSSEEATLLLTRSEVEF